MFRIKWVLQYFQSFVEVLMVGSFLFSQVYASEVKKEGRAKTILWSLLGILTVGAWIVSGKLLFYDYRKRLSEGKSTHWLFWSLNLIIDVTLTALSFKDYVMITCSPFSE